MTRVVFIHMLSILAVLATLTVPAAAQESDATDVVDQSEEVMTADERATPEAAQTDSTDENAPAAETLKSRQLSDAFKNFRPSEEISADNAVTFPADI